MVQPLNPWSHLVSCSGTSLITYATLAPGARQSGTLAGLKGIFHKGHILGTFFPEGQGTSDGYPGIRLHDDGMIIPAWMFKFDDLPEVWPYLDVYEGDEYVRLPCMFVHEKGKIEWSEVYALAREHPEAEPCPFDLPGLPEPPIGEDGQHDLRLVIATDSA